MGAFKWIFDSFSCGCNLNFSKEEGKLELVSRMRSCQSRVSLGPLAELLSKRDRTCPKKELSITVCSTPRILFIILLFLLPQDAWNFSTIFPREKFLQQIKSHVKNLVRQINKEAQIDPNNTNAIASDMDGIRITKQISSPNKTRLPLIAVDLNKLAKYFERLSFEICSNYATEDEFWMYLRSEKTQCKTLIDLTFPKTAKISFKSSEIRVSNGFSCLSYQFIDESFCLSVLPRYKLEMKIVGFVVKKLLI